MVRKRRSPSNPHTSGPGPEATDLLRAVAYHPRALDVCRRAAESALEYRLHVFTGGPKPKHTADMWVSAFVRDQEPDRTERNWWTHYFLSLTLAIVKSDPRYWGVTNPVEQLTCTACRAVLPTNQFGATKLVCNSCKEGNSGY